MNFDLLKKMYNWNFCSTSDVKTFVPDTINSDEFKQITSQDYETNTDQQQNTQTNQGTTNQTNG